MTSFASRRRICAIAASTYSSCDRGTIARCLSAGERNAILNQVRSTALTSKTARSTNEEAGFPMRTPLIHLDLTWLGRFCLRQDHGDQSIVYLGANFSLIDLARKLETPAVVANVVFGVDGLQPLIF